MTACVPESPLASTRFSYPTRPANRQFLHEWLGLVGRAASTARRPEHVQDAILRPTMRSPSSVVACAISSSCSAATAVLHAKRSLSRLRRWWGTGEPGLAVRQ